ncbi:MAG: leucine-rich repeat domain-containing protein, partial [Sphingobacterium sp.]
MTATYRIGCILLLIGVVILVSCDKTEEFPANSSIFILPQNDNNTLIYEGKKAGDFEVASDEMNWSGIKKLIVKGHINNKDIGIIKRYIAEAFNGELREVDFRDAEVFEGQFINSPFHKLKNLDYFVFPRKIKSTGDNVMSESYWIREVIVPEDVEIIGDLTFQVVSLRLDVQQTGHVYPIDIPYMPIEKYQLPNTVREIGQFAYRYYPYEDLELPESVEVIKRGCFANTKLTSFTFPPKVTALPDECFLSSADLETITLPEGLKSIGSAPFAG